MKLPKVQVRCVIAQTDVVVGRTSWRRRVAVKVARHQAEILCSGGETLNRRRIAGKNIDAIGGADFGTHRGRSVSVVRLVVTIGPNPPLRIVWEIGGVRGKRVAVVASRRIVRGGNRNA